MFQKVNSSVNVTAKGLKKVLRDTLSNQDDFFDKLGPVIIKTVNIRTDNTFNKVLVQESKILQSVFVCVKRYFIDNHSIVLDHYNK